MTWWSYSETVTSASHNSSESLRYNTRVTHTTRFTEIHPTTCITSFINKETNKKTTNVALLWYIVAHTVIHDFTLTATSLHTHAWFSHTHFPPQSSFSHCCKEVEGGRISFLVLFNTAERETYLFILLHKCMISFFVIFVHTVFFFSHL